MRNRLVLVLGLLVLLRPIAGHAQSRLLSPPAQGAREVRGFFLPPAGEPARGYVAGHALLLRDPGGLVAELSLLCAAAGSAPDGSRPAIRRRVAALEVRRARADLRAIEYGTVPPGRYLALGWIEFQWPPSGRGDSTRIRRHFGADTVTVSIGTDTALVMFTAGHPRFPAWDARSKALSCLEFLVVPEPAERVVTPIALRRTRAARPT